MPRIAGGGANGDIIFDIAPPPFGLVPETPFGFGVFVFNNTDGELTDVQIEWEVTDDPVLALSLTDKKTTRKRVPLAIAMKKRKKQTGKQAVVVSGIEPVPNISVGSSETGTIEVDVPPAAPPPRMTIATLVALRPVVGGIIPIAIDADPGPIGGGGGPAPISINVVVQGSGTDNVEAVVTITNNSATSYGGITLKVYGQTPAVAGVFVFSTDAATSSFDGNSYTAETTYPTLLFGSSQSITIQLSGSTAAAERVFTQDVIVASSDMGFSGTAGRDQFGLAPSVP